MRLPSPDEWAEEDEWKKLAEELGAVPPVCHHQGLEQPVSATEEPGVASASPEAPDQTAASVTEAVAQTVATAARWGEDKAENASFAAETADEPAEGTATELATASSAGEETEEAGSGRKRRRRRRRRRRSGGEPTAVEGTNASAEAESVVADTDTDVNSAADALVTEDGEEPVTENVVEQAAWPEGTDPDQAAEILREILAQWNVPSWDEIVAGLYRPER